MIQKQLLPPKIEFNLPSEKEVGLGARATFPIDYYGEECEIKWLFNNLPLSSDFQVTQSTTGNKHSTKAIIEKMKISLDGELTCQIINQVNESYESYQVTN